MFSMLEHLKVTVTVQRPGAPGQFGKVNPGTSFDIPGCLFAPTAGTGRTSSREVTEQQMTVITGAALYLPAGSDLRPTDRVVVKGLTYEVEGEVGDWGASGLQVALERSTG